jgi:phosphoglycolate phosphatase-like HAD superfamily hydrolase
MTANDPTVLALDFDGVVCDGLIEYFQTAWRAYCQLWSSTYSTDSTPPEGLAEKFYRLRPVVESGWEMPVLLHVLLKGVTEEEILSSWGTIAPEQAAAAGFTSGTIASVVDQIRDQWIHADLDGWLAQHRFYPGIIDRMQKILHSQINLFIITTKEGRFVRQLLQQQQVNLPETQIFGKEVKQPKTQTLKMLEEQFSQNTTEFPRIWFIEDRLKTLQAVQAEAGLSAIELFLADWGYNTATDRQLAAHNPKLHLLSLQTFAQDFSAWVEEVE